MKYIKLNNGDIFQYGFSEAYSGYSADKYVYYIEKKKVIIYVNEDMTEYLINDGLNINNNVSEELKINCKLRLISKLRKA